MKKIVLWMLALTLLLGCVPASAEFKEEIRFSEIPWGSDMETACRILLAAGVINEDGVSRFEQTEKVVNMRRTGRWRGSETSYPHFVPNLRDYRIEQEEESANVESVSLMSGMVIGDWLGIEVHHIELVFALDGETEKLVHAEVSLMVNRENLEPQLESLYGKADRRVGYGLFWRGANQTALLYEQTAIHYGLLNAKEIVDAAEIKVTTPTPRPRSTPTPVPEPTPEPTPTPAPTYIPPVENGPEGSDVLDYTEGGEITFLGIPWNSDRDTAMEKLASEGLIASTLPADAPGHQGNTGAVIMLNGDEPEISMVKRLMGWENYYLDREKELGGRKTCAGLPIGAIRITFRRKNDQTALKSIEIYLNEIDGEAARKVISERVSAVFGEGKECFDRRIFWQGENDTLLQLTWRDSYCRLTYGINTNPKLR